MSGGSEQMAQEGDNVQVEHPALPSVAAGSRESPSTSGKMLTPGLSPPSPYSPFVDSKDWERDILGVARCNSSPHVRWCRSLCRMYI